MPDSLRRRFEVHFGRSPEVSARAPGRVNLIGEHTDYNAGLVLPCAIDRDTVVLAAPRSDGVVRVWSTDLASEREFRTNSMRPDKSWIDYVKGVVFALRERGIEIGGADLAVESQVPRESGLSSSAALGVAVVTAFDLTSELRLDALDRARIAHRGESEFVGVGCGIMDQFASALGRPGHALRIDCLDQSVTPVPLPAEKFRLLVVHSGATRALAHGGYLDRVEDCRAALEAARWAGIASPDAETLRELGPADLPRLEALLDGVALRRARHVILENERVEAFCRALAAEDLAAAGEILGSGQRSLRDDYEVSTPELDALCEIADAIPGVFGSRLTGAGFGGCSLHLVDPVALPKVRDEISAGFGERFGREPPSWEFRAAGGASGERLI